jgi:hypothetical protein
MSDWILNLPVLWMGVVILGAIYAATAAMYLLVTAFADDDRARVFKAISPGMLPPLSVVFALLVGFLAAQVWSDADRANGAVNREAGALRAIVLMATAFPGDTEARLRDLVRAHIEDAVATEWPAMSRHRATLTLVPPRLAESLQLVLALNPQGNGQLTAQREMVEAIQTALDARRQRVILSESSINWVKWTVLLVQAGLTLLAVALIHCDNRRANQMILAIFATSVGVAIVLLAAHSRPFSGEIAVSPAVLLQVMPEATAPEGHGSRR